MLVPAYAPLRLLVLCTVALVISWLAADDGPSRVSVVLALDASEAGPASCPSHVQPLLADLEAPDAATRLHARSALVHLDWRHLSWLRAEAMRGSAERRLALRLVIDALLGRRWSGAPAAPPRS